jgi:hypothetical protein
LLENKWCLLEIKQLIAFSATNINELFFKTNFLFSFFKNVSFFVDKASANSVRQGKKRGVCEGMERKKPFEVTRLQMVFNQKDSY